MLLYHPAFDFYHAIFRILRLLENLPNEPIEIERLRILDFYSLFPGQLQQFTFPAEYRTLKRDLKTAENPYQQISDPKRIFSRLEPYQACALKGLAAHGFIDGPLLADGKILRTQKPLPRRLSEAIKESSQAQALVRFLTGPMSRIDLYGRSGLKGRSDLFEYRYDPANSTTSP